MLIEIIIFYLCVMLASGIYTFIYRFQNPEFPKSNKYCYCDKCNHKLKFWESNFPIFNYFILKGKCQYCNQKIEKIHLAFELLIGLILFNFWMVLI